MEILWLNIAVIIIALVLTHYNLLQDTTGRGLEAFSVGVILCRLKDKVSEERILAVVVFAVSVVLIALLPSQQRIILMFISFPAVILLCVWMNDYLFLKSSSKNIQIVSMLGKVFLKYIFGIIH